MLSQQVTYRVMFVVAVCANPIEKVIGISNTSEAVDVFRIVSGVCMAHDTFYDYNITVRCQNKGRFLMLK